MLAWLELPALQTLGVPTGALVHLFRKGPNNAERFPVCSMHHASSDIHPTIEPANMVTPLECGSGFSGITGAQLSADIPAKSGRYLANSV